MHSTIEALRTCGNSFVCGHRMPEPSGQGRCDSRSSTTNSAKQFQQRLLCRISEGSAEAQSEVRRRETRR